MGDAEYPPVAYTADETAREASSIERLSMQMRSAIDSQQKAVMVLRDRLSPILRPDVEKTGSDETVPHIVRSPLVDQWTGMVEGVEATTRRIHELLQGLDL